MENFSTAKERNSLISMKSEQKLKLKLIELQEVTKVFLTYPSIYVFTLQTVNNKKIQNKKK